MRVFALALALTSALCVNSVRSQDLLQTLPEDVIAYYRAGNTLDAIKSFGSQTGLFSDPAAFEEMILGTLDEVLAQVSQSAGLENVSLSGFLKSVTRTEFCLYGIHFTDVSPELDFAVALESPLAEDIEEFVNTLLEKKNLGFKRDDGSTEIDTPGGQPLLFGRKNNMIILAGGDGRLRRVMNSFGKPVAKGLAASQRFLRSTGKGDASFGNLFVRLDKVLEIVRREMPSRVRRTSDRIMKSLGIWNLRDLGYAEDIKGSMLRVTAEGEMPLFDLVSAPVSDATTLRTLPADTLFAYSWNGLPEFFWAKGTALFLDGRKFMFAPFVQEGIRMAQKRLGFKFEDMVKHLDIGMTVGMVPDAKNGFDGTQNWFFTSRVKEEEPLLEMARTSLGAEAERKGLRLEEIQVGTWTELRIVLAEEPGQGEEPSEADIEAAFWVKEYPRISIGNGHLVAGSAHAMGKLRDSLDGRASTLDKTGMLKGIQPRASAYLFVGLGTLTHMRDMSFGSSNPFKRTASLAASFELKQNEVVMRSKQPIMSTMFMIPMMLFGVSRTVEEEIELDEEGNEVKRSRTVRIGGAREPRRMEAGEAPKPADPPTPVEPAPAGGIGGGGGR